MIQLKCYNTFSSMVDDMIIKCDIMWTCCGLGIYNCVTNNIHLNREPKDE